MEKLVNSVAPTNSVGIEHVSSRDISAALDAMLNNKAGDRYGLRTEHYKLAGDLYHSALASCFNAMLTHGHMDIYQLFVQQWNIRKAIFLLFQFSNYRPIALATIFSKILEQIILDRIYEHLNTTDNQFGFKWKHNTLMPVLLLKEILMPVTDAQETCTRNWYQFLPAFWYWYRIEHVLSQSIRIWYQKKSMQNCMSYVPETGTSFSGTSFWYRFLERLSLV